MPTSKVNAAIHFVNTKCEQKSLRLEPKKIQAKPAHPKVPKKNNSMENRRVSSYQKFVSIWMYECVSIGKWVVVQVQKDEGLTHWLNISN